MSYGQFIRILWRQKFIALVVAAVVVIGGYGFLAREPKEYRSTATVALLPKTADIQAAAFHGEIVKSLVPSYGELIKSRSFLDKVGSELPFGRDGSQLQNDVFVEPVVNAGILRVTARAPVAAQAAQIVVATVETFKSAVAEESPVLIRVIDDARVPDQPVAPKPKVVLMASVVLGLMIGTAAALGWERLFGRIRETRGLAEASGLPVLGVLPRERSLRTAPRIAIGDPAMRRFEESLCVLRTNLAFEMDTSRIRSIAITSLGAQDGKSLLAANLAVALGELGVQVLVVDAHARHPCQHELFQLANDAGLSSVAFDGSSASTLAQDTAYSGVRVIVAGPPLADRTHEMDLYLQRMPRLVNLADLVIVDAPPLGASADVRLMVSSVDAVILAVRAGSVSAAEMKAAVDALRLPDTKMLGTVLTSVISRRTPLLSSSKAN